MAERTKRVDACIDEIAAVQHGIVTRRQLLAAGLTARVVGARLAQHRLIPVHRGVYRVGPVASPYGREMAAVLACGPGAAVAGWSAMRLWQLPEPPAALRRRAVGAPAAIGAPGAPAANGAPGAPDAVSAPRAPAAHGARGAPAAHRVRGAPASVAVPAGECVFLVSANRDCGRRPGIQLSRVRLLSASEVTRCQGIPVTTVARTLLDIAVDLGRAGLLRELEQAVGHAQRERLVTAGEMEVFARRHPRHPGSALLERLVKGDLAVTRSQAEERMLGLIRSARLPTPQVNASVAGFTVDFHWPAQRLVVEVDGFSFHAQRDRFEGDRVRDLELTAAGQTVRRITWRQLTGDPVAVVGQIALALGRAGA